LAGQDKFSGAVLIARGEKILLQKSYVVEVRMNVRRVVSGHTKDRFCEPRPSEVRVTESRASKIRPSEVRLVEVRPGEHCPDESRFAEVRVTKIRPFEVRIIEVHVGEIDAVKVCASEIQVHPKTLFPPPLPDFDILLEQGELFGVGHKALYDQRASVPKPNSRNSPPPEAMQDQLADSLRALVIPRGVLNWLHQAVAESDLTERAARERETKRLEEQHRRIDSKLEVMYEDRLEGRISPEMYDPGGGCHRRRSRSAGRSFRWVRGEC
jgi:hypothetical protein